jgi:methylated-DNA-[protein]-cysteine S-methyltransferase
MTRPSPYSVLTRDLVYDWHPAPIGDLLLAGDTDGTLHLVSFSTGPKEVAPADHWTRSATPFARAKTQLDEYFSGERTRFDLGFTLGGTDFQNLVWQTLAGIPFGRTWSYGDMAKTIGRPSASRAVGAANGANPLPIILPCHRVIGANGDLTGFGGGMATKTFLLRLEGALAPPASEQMSLL